jgi:hypothetical protein
MKGCGKVQAYPCKCQTNLEVAISADDANSSLSGRRFYLHTQATSLTYDRCLFERIQREPVPPLVKLVLPANRRVCQIKQ